MNKVKNLDLCDIKQVCAITKNLEGDEMIDIKSMIEHTRLITIYGI